MRITKVRLLFFITMMFASNNAYSVYACVSDITATTPDSDFIINGDETVTHNPTGLTWKRCAEGLSGSACEVGAATTHTWQQALQIPVDLNAATGFAGRNDWRLPNIRELNTIFEARCSDPYINMTIFPATPSDAFWSSTPYLAIRDDSPYIERYTRSWAVYFSGSPTGPLLRYYLYSVRLVRGGKN